MRVFILTVYVGLIAWIAVAGGLGTGVAMAAAAAMVVFAFRPAAAAEAITGWARASVARRS